MFSCEVGISKNVESQMEICLLTHEAKIHKDHINGLFPVSVWSQEKGVTGVVESVIKSCMRQQSAEHKTTPWDVVVKRLKDYGLSHTAHVNPEPLHIDIQIFRTVT